MAKSLRNAWRNNGLSIALFALFFAALFGNSLAGLDYRNYVRQSYGHPPASYLQFLATGAFLKSIFVNWAAAFLQLACLIPLSGYLFQRGSSKSQDPDEPRVEHPEKAAIWRGRRPARALLWLYANSLSLAFWLLFLASFILAVIFGTKSDNEERLLRQQPTVTLWQYFLSSSFWFSTLQAWQGEFIAIAALIVLSITLRATRSAESKAVDAPDNETGLDHEKCRERERAQRESPGRQHPAPSL